MVKLYNKFRKDYSTPSESDALVNFHLLTKEEGGNRRRAAYSGYRPQYKLLDDYQTSTAHFFLIDEECLQLGESAQAFIKFITPEYYPNSLTVNQVVEVYEGALLVAKSTILEIYNDILVQ